MPSDGLCVKHSGHGLLTTMRRRPKWLAAFPVRRIVIKGGPVDVFSDFGGAIAAKLFNRKFLAICSALISIACENAVVAWGQNDALANGNPIRPVEWPWKTWQRSANGLERWEELDVDGIQAWRQSFKAFDGSTKGTIFLTLAPTDPSAKSDPMPSQIELPRLDNVVERVWWWSPLGQNQSATTQGEIESIGDAYRMPFVPPQNRLMKLTQTPSRWTLAFNDPPAVSRALMGGGVVVVDVRGEPKWSADAELIQAGEDGVLVLPASQAKVFGKLLQFEPLPHKNTVGYWVNADDYATWKVAVPATGPYQVQLFQGCGGGQGGSRIALRFDDTVLETLVEETGHFQNFRWRELGPVTLQAGANIDVSLRCLTKAKAAVMDVRQIRLVPVDATVPNDVRSIAADVDLPPLTHESPGPGRRSIRKAAVVDDSQAYHLVSLPTDWVPSRRYPVLVEWTGNGPFENDRGDRSSGRVEDANLAYGLGGGDGSIVLTLPFVNDAGTANVSKWWGDTPAYRPDSTIAYAKAAIDEVCEQFGGDRSQLILVGFSRGSIACNAVGLANDDVASWWRGFVCCSHYDGVRQWPPTGDEAASLARLARLGNRPQLIVAELAIGDSASNLEQTERYLQRNAIDSGNLTLIETGFVNHSDAWALRPCPARTRAREWLAELLRN